MAAQGLVRYFLGVAACALVITAWADAPTETRRAFETRLLLLDADVAGQNLVAVGERGFILRSENGRAWRVARTVGDATLTALSRRGSQLWAVGHDATILKSTDQGSIWRRVHYAPQQQRPLLDILVVDDTHGFAVGAYGYVLETNDAGEHWTPRSIAAEDRHYNAVAVLGNGNLLIVGEAGTLLRSIDSGKTWQPLASPYAGSWFGIVPLEKNAALIFGLRGKLYRTDDAGAHWVALDSHTSAALMGGRVLTDGTIIVVGEDGVVLSSRDQGRSFGLHPQPGNAAYSTVLGSAQSGWLFGERGVTRWIPAR